MSTLKSKLKSENSLIFNRHSHVGDIVSAVSEIYQEEVNISIWQRKLNANIIEAAKNVVEVKPNLQISEIVFPNDVSDILSSKI